jgi:outer membrane protein TolC
MAQPSSLSPPSSLSQWRLSDVEPPITFSLLHPKMGHPLRVGSSRSLLQVERDLQQFLMNLEVAYWNLYAANSTLECRQQVLRFVFEAFELTRARYEAGRATQADVCQARGQYEVFRAQLAMATAEAAAKERQLRAFLGLANGTRLSEVTRLRLSDVPTLSPTEPDWNGSLKEALEKSPTLRITRQDVRFAQKVLEVARQLAPNSTDDQEDQRLRIRQARLALARTMETLTDQELKTQSFLYEYYRRLNTNYEQIRANRAQREAFAEQLKARQQAFQAGRDTLDTLLEAQRFWVEALASERQAIAAYNNALAGFAYTRGVGLQRYNVTIERDE